jgi:hypothetical protein
VPLPPLLKQAAQAATPLLRSATKQEDKQVEALAPLPARQGVGLAGWQEQLVGAAVARLVAVVVRLVGAVQLAAAGLVGLAHLRGRAELPLARLGRLHRVQLAATQLPTTCGRPGSDRYVHVCAGTNHAVCV